MRLPFWPLLPNSTSPPEMQKKNAISLSTMSLPSTPRHEYINAVTEISTAHQITQGTHFLIQAFYCSRGAERCPWQRPLPAVRPPLPWTSPLRSRRPLATGTPLGRQRGQLHQDSSPSSLPVCKNVEDRFCHSRVSGTNPPGIRRRVDKREVRGCGLTLSHINSAGVRWG